MNTPINIENKVEVAGYWSGFLIGLMLGAIALMVAVGGTCRHFYEGRQEAIAQAERNKSDAKYWERIADKNEEWSHHWQAAYDEKVSELYQAKGATSASATWSNNISISGNVLRTARGSDTWISINPK